jgi:hypothetical protein
MKLSKLFKSKWGKWVDISTGCYSYNSYVLQVRRYKNGKVKFRVAKSRTAFNCAPPTVEKLNTVES